MKIPRAGTRRRGRVPSGCGAVGADSRSRTSLMVQRTPRVRAPTGSMGAAMSVLECLPLAAVLGGLVRGDGRGRMPTTSLVRGPDPSDDLADDNPAVRVRTARNAAPETSPSGRLTSRTPGAPNIPRRAISRRTLGFFVGSTEIGGPIHPVRTRADRRRSRSVSQASRNSLSDLTDRASDRDANPTPR